MGQQQQNDTKVLLANIDDTQAMQAQNTIDNTVSLPPAICSLDALRLTPEDLYKDVKEFV